MVNPSLEPSPTPPSGDLEDARQVAGPTSAGCSHTASCLVCGANHWRVVREARDYWRPQADQVYRVAKCQSCGLLAQRPMPDEAELRAAYDIPAWPSFRIDWEDRSWSLPKLLRRLTVWRRLWRLRHHASGRELLEVGCGTGAFLAAARRAGWRVHAVEYASWLAEVIRDGLGIDVRDGTLRPGLWPEGSFDVVAFWEVLEHVPDPLADLALAARYLRPGGVVLLSFPSDDAIWKGRLFGENWGCLELPRHLHFLSAVALARLCERAGLQLVRYRTPLVDTCWAYLISAWRQAFRRGAGFGPLARFAGRCVVVALATPYLVVESWKGRGPQAFAVALKPGEEVPSGVAGAMPS
jgi:SAM-dependent methyltransferase